jgi:hypothetical protein
MVKNMGMVYISTQVVINIKVNGEMVKNQEMVYLNIQMELDLKENF